MELRPNQKSTTPFPSQHKWLDWQLWWRQLRPHTLTASIIPVFIGTALAFKFGEIDWGLFITMLLASIMIQVATNLFNEYYDYKRGLDTEQSVGIGGAIVHDGMRPESILNLALLLFALSLLLGVYICLNSSWWVALIGSICMAMGYLYTGGPFPIAYSPFGEIVAGFFMGPVIILISFYIQTGTVTVYTLLVSVPIAILVAAILLANNIRDLEGDRLAGRRTLAIIVGQEKAILFLGFMFAFAYLWTVGLILFTDISLWTLLVLISVPTAVKAVRGFNGKSQPIEMMPAMKSTAQLHLRYGLLLTLALIL